MLGFFGGSGVQTRLNKMRVKLHAADVAEAMAVRLRGDRAWAIQDKKLSAWGSGFFGHKQCKMINEF